MDEMRERREHSEYMQPRPSCLTVRGAIQGDSMNPSDLSNDQLADAIKIQADHRRECNWIEMADELDEAARRIREIHTGFHSLDCKCKDCDDTARKEAGL